MKKKNRKRWIIKSLFKILTGPRGFNFGFIIYEYFSPLFSSIIKKEKLIAIFPSSIRLNKFKAEQLADPFLLATEDSLYCFYEEKSRINPGKIRVITHSKSGNTSNNYCEFNNNSHMSFPFVFREQDFYYIIPESVALQEVAIYKPVKFPVEWEKYKILLKGNFVDSHILLHNDIYFLFSTEKIEASDKKEFEYRLCLYTSSEFSKGYVLHPASPISTGRKYSRSGGSIICENGVLYRLAQDCFDSYGKDLHIFKINKLSKFEYTEELYFENWISTKLGFSNGGHHLSVCSWQNSSFVAIDLNRKDSYLQRFIKPFLK